MADFEKIKKIKVAKEKDSMQKVEISLSDEEQQTLNIGLLKADTQNFVTMVEGYYKIFVDAQKSLSEKPASKQTADPLGELLLLFFMLTKSSFREISQ